MCFLAKQMGTSVKMIEEHYGRINPVKNAERILQGMPGWEPIAAAPQLPAQTGPRERGSGEGQSRPVEALRGSVLSKSTPGAKGSLAPNALPAL